MDDIRQSIISLDNNVKTLATHYDGRSSNGLKILNEQISNIEKRWTKLIDDLEQCSNRVRLLKFSFQERAIIYANLS